MRVVKITSALLLLTLLAGPAQAQLNFNWVYEPGGAGNMVDHQPKLQPDGRIAARPSTGMAATWNGPPGPLHDFTQTDLPDLPGATGVNSISGVNSDGYFAVGKIYTEGGETSGTGAWTYSSVGWTPVVDTAGHRKEAEDQCEEYAVIGGSQQRTIWTVPFYGAGAGVATTLPNKIGAEPGMPRISDSGEYIAHSDGAWAAGARISYGANWNSYTDIPSPMKIVTDVNNDGDAIGYDATTAYYYDFSENTVETIPFGTGWDASWNQLRPDGMNNHGDVVGRIRDKDEPNGNKSLGLFFYDRSENTTTWLWDLVDDEHPSVWNPHEQWGFAHSINDDGWIAGASYGDTPSGGADTQCMWLLTAPGPTHNPGDVTGDNFVGGADLTKIIDNWGMSPADWGDGDIDPFDAGDDFIGGADYTQVLNNWGTSYGPEPVPEPAAMAAMLLGGLALLGRRKQ